jgi:HlyD family secretion protein
MKRNLLFYILGVIAVVGAGGAGGAVSLLVARQMGCLKHPDSAKSAVPSVDEDPEAPEAKIKVTASGRIRPKSGVINVSGTPGDRLWSLEDEAKEGNPVKRDDSLAVLESSHLRQAERDLAETQLVEAKERKTAEERYAAALLKEAELAKEQVKLESHERESLKEKIKVLEAKKKSADDDLRRFLALRESDGDEIVSNQMLEHQELLVASTTGELAASNAQLKKLNESIELGAKQAEAKYRTAELSKAKIPGSAQLESLEKNVELAQKRLDSTTIRAPSDGTILKVFLSPGETLAQQPILQMADTRKMVVVAEIPEEQAHLVAVGDQVEIEDKAFDKVQDGHVKHVVLHGTVTNVGTIVARNPVAPSSPTAPADKHVIDAQIELERPMDVKEAARLIELEVTVKILAGQTPVARADAADCGVEPDES